MQNSLDDISVKAVYIRFYTFFWNVLNMKNDFLTCLKPRNYFNF